ncbi:hypothetical protein ACFQZU_23930, partial [Streptomonospora algeriensis]
MATCAQATEAVSVIPPHFPGPVLPAAQALAGQAGWLLGLGIAGVVATALAPGPAAVRLRGLRRSRGAESDAGRSAAERAVLLARRLRAGLALVMGRRVQERRRRAVVELCAVLAAELRAGREPGAALVTAVAELGPES